MATTAGPARLNLEPPGPGHWEQDPVHFPRPMSRYFQQTHPSAFKRGTNDFSRFYGLLIDGLQMGYVSGFGYNQVIPAPDAEVPARFARAEQALGEKLWREQLREWDGKVKPESIARHKQLQSVDPENLSDEELAAYLVQCRDHHAAMMAQHMRFTAAAVLPTGDFLIHAGEWTGLPHSELLGLLRDASAVSAGGSDEVERLKKAIASDLSARKAMDSDDDPAEVLSRLRNLDGEAGAAFAAWLDLVGNRLVDGFDITEPTALELPDALLRSIRIALSGEKQSQSDVVGQTAEIRGLVPAASRAEFDDLLGEARLMYRLRDERGVYSDIWASGIMRRGALAAGRRAAGLGRIGDPVLMLDANLEEMCAMVLGDGGPSSDVLAERAAFRASHTARDAPPSLGPAAPPPPDLSDLPPAVARLMGAMFVSLGHVFGSSQAQNEETVLYGLAASKGVYEGTARRVSGPSEFGRIAKGDVLVTELTTEAFNILLPLLGGIVTDNGGLLSHAAIVSREYGIPGVVGTREATERIMDGMMIRVDGEAGEVTVLR